MSGLCVIGLQWGDEAKGKFVDLLTGGKEIVVRYQGGANAGHTVVVGDQVYKLHHVPSGIINDNVLNVISSGVVVHPETLLGEIDSLLENGIDVQGRLVLSDRAHVVFPWHLKEDQIFHAVADDEDNIGTTLRGIGPCYKDKVGRSFAIRLGDLVRDDLEERIRKVASAKQKILSALNDNQAVELDASAIYQAYRGFAERLKPMIRDTAPIVLDAVDRGAEVLYEGAQGALLDIDHGTFPFVTSSNSSGVGITAGSGVPPKWIDKVIGVAKCYSTRVGGGPFPTELSDDVGQHIRDRGNEYGTTTGRPRRCGWFDAVAVRYTARLSGVDTMAITMLDVLSELEEIQICIAYEIDGQRTEQFPSHVDDLKRAKPIFETMPGWQSEITGVTEIEDLPPQAIALAQQISKRVGVPIEYLSVGPDRGQTIVCGQKHFVTS